MNFDHYQVFTKSSFYSCVLSFLISPPSYLLFFFLFLFFPATSFPYDEIQLVQFERHLLHLLCFDIVPQIAPAMLVRQMFSLWMEPLPVGITSSNEIIQLADTLIGQFWKDSSDSLRFAPSTIAISALLLAFSKCKMNCSAWLRRLPDEMLPSKPSTSTPHTLFATHEMSFLDIDGCLLAMTKEKTSGDSSQHRNTISFQPDNNYRTPPISPDTTVTTTNMTLLPPRKHHRAGTPTTVMTSFTHEMIFES